MTEDQRETIGALVDALDGALGFSKNLGPNLPPGMAADAAQSAIRTARDGLAQVCRQDGFDPWGDDYLWEP